MYLALVGTLMFFAIIYLLMKEKAIPLVVLTVVPIVCMFLGGYGFDAVINAVASGMTSVWKNAALFIEGRCGRSHHVRHRTFYFT